MESIRFYETPAYGRKITAYPTRKSSTFYIVYFPVNIFLKTIFTWSKFNDMKLEIEIKLQALLIRIY